MEIPDPRIHGLTKPGGVVGGAGAVGGATLGTARLRDGTIVGFRLGTPDDRAMLLSAFEQLSPRSRYLRFFTAMPRLPEGVVDRLVDVGSRGKVAVVVFELDNPTSLVGVVRYFRTPGTDRADVAFTVLDEWQGRGIAGLAFAKCVELAQAEGITTFTASTLSENTQMLSFFRRRGAATSRDPEDLGVINVTMDLVPSDASPIAA